MGKMVWDVFRMLLRVIVLVLLIFCGMLFTGCSKEVVLDGYNAASQSVGDMQLTFFPEGERTYGGDHYTGSCQPILDLPDGSIYFGIAAEDFSGKVELEIK